MAFELVPVPVAVFTGRHRAERANALHADLIPLGTPSPWRSFAASDADLKR
jgi:hypothetical protein